MFVAIVSIIILLAVVGIFMIQKMNRQEVEDKLSVFEHTIQDRGFVVTKKLRVGDSVLFVDDQNKMWTIYGSNLEKAKRFPYSSITAFEVFVDGLSVISGKTGGSLAGALLAGATGAVIGSSGERAVSDTVSTVQLHISVNDIETPSVRADLLVGSVPKGGHSYSNLMGQVHEMVSVFHYMQEQSSVPKP